jgi:type IV pilus assembly protein PilB
VPYIPEVNLDTYIIKPEIVSIIPETVVKKYNIMPVFGLGNSVTIATSEPGNLKMLDMLEKTIGKDVDIVYAEPENIRKAIAHYYGVLGSIEEVLESLSDEVGVSAEELALAAQEQEVVDEDIEVEEAPIINLVNLLLNQAIIDRASDVHIEPTEHDTMVRIRIDGELKETKRLSLKFHSPIVSRIKVMGQMDIAESRIPQDGQTQFTSKGKTYECRISVLPGIYGENIVVRILDKSKLKLDIESLGLDPDARLRFEKLIKVPYGMILVTGPTGSGKTTTLYTVISITQDIRSNTITLDDPVEYQIPNIRQIQVNTKAGLTFSSGLRSILRQDPDVIMVGEIRDLETAELAVRSSLTGHVVYSTLHTNDAPGALTRLIDMGVEPFLVSASVTGVLAQRLVRVNCKHCKKPYAPPKELMKSLGLTEEDGPFYKGKGCKSCRKTGFFGREGIFELMIITESIKDLILAEASLREIREKAVSEGMNTLRHGILTKVKEGVTTAEEAINITQFLD